MRRATPFLLLLALAALFSACAPVTTIRPDDPPAVFASPGRHGDATLERFSPAFLIHNPGTEFNRPGSPVASRDAEGNETIRMDVSRPAIFAEEKTFRTERGEYRNLVYRVHFPETPVNLYPFLLTAGDNVGLLVIVTLDAQGRPVLVSQTGTCGCYIAMVPTDATPKDALPEGWTGEPLDIFTERLTPLLAYGTTPDPRLLVEVRPGGHRVMDIRLLTDPPGSVSGGAVRWVDAPLRAMAELKRLPLGDATTSLYYGEGILEGHVKGSWKPWETLLMSWFSLDFFVGMDKEYGNPENPFYTSLKVWARQDSNMAEFPKFLKYWGWGL